MHLAHRLSTGRGERERVTGGGRVRALQLELEGSPFKPH